MIAVRRAAGHTGDEIAGPTGMGTDPVEGHVGSRLRDRGPPQCGRRPPPAVRGSTGSLNHRAGTAATTTLDRLGAAPASISPASIWVAPSCVHAPSNAYDMRS